MVLSPLTKQAIAHTKHCLIGCGIGEVAGMAIGQNMSNLTQTVLATSLAFTFGYLLTFYGATKKGMSFLESVKLAFAVDTISITSMEVVDNISVWLIPGAINARINNALFWWSLMLSLSIAFVLTVPVNRFVISKSKHSHNHHH